VDLERFDRLGHEAAAAAVAAAGGQFSLFSQHFLLFSSSPA